MSTQRPAAPAAARTGGGVALLRGREGVITGAVLRAIRESLALTQEDLAAELGADPNTVQSWESGRRPLTATKVSTLAGLRRDLVRHGADPRAVAVLDTAIEADHILRHVIDAPAADLRRHPLATTVLRRDVIEALGWAFTGAAPTALGQAAGRPVVPAPERSAFFANLRSTVETSARRHRGPADPQPHRQLYYLLAWAPDAQTRAWLADRERAERRAWRPGGWTPRWVTARSLSIGQARHGDPAPLQDFVARGLADDRCRSADLAYWAYWLGDTDGTWRTDDAMATTPALPGGRLLARFTDRLTPTEPLLDLYAASTKALVASRPGLLDSPARVTALSRKVEGVLTVNHLHPSTRRDLEDLRFGLRLAAR